MILMVLFFIAIILNSNDSRMLKLSLISFIVCGIALSIPVLDSVLDYIICATLMSCYCKAISNIKNYQALAIMVLIMLGLLATLFAINADYLGLDDRILLYSEIMTYITIAELLILVIFSSRITNAISKLGDSSSVHILRGSSNNPTRL